MKKITCLLLALALLLCLAACGGEPAADAGEPVAESEEPVAESEEPVAESEEPVTESEAPFTGSEAPVAESEAPAEEATPLETAKEFEGANLEDLIAAIGEPQSSDYAPSCLGEGEDGNLYYDGFTVYTYRDVDGTEVVNYVE